MAEKPIALSGLALVVLVVESTAWVNTIQDRTQRAPGPSPATMGKATDCQQIWTHGAQTRAERVEYRFGQQQPAATPSIDDNATQLRPKERPQ